MSRRRAPLLLAVWAAGVVLATATGLLAVSLVADAVGDPAVPVLSADDLVAVSPAPARTTPRPPSASPGGSRVRVFSSTGGSVGVRCVGGVPEQVYVTPAPGYGLDETSREGAALEVRFESGRTRVRLTLGCADGAPALLDRRTDTSGKG